MNILENCNTDKGDYIIFYEDNIKYKYPENQIDKNKLNRSNDKPTLLLFNKYNRLKEKHYYNIKGMLHRQNDKPAIIQYFKNGLEKRNIYYQYNTLHRKPPLDADISNISSRYPLNFKYIFGIQYRFITGLPTSFIYLYKFIEDSNKDESMLVTNLKHKDKFIAKYCIEKLLGHNYEF